MNVPVNQLKAITEAALFAADEPLTLDRIVNLFSGSDLPSTKEILQVLAELQTEYADRAVNLIEVGSGYRFQTSANYAVWIARLWDEKPPRYSRALLETLAIIAYRQPVTRAEIEDIRGVAISTSIMKTLLDREWIKVLGQRDIPGKPSIYGTTKQFLDYFNLPTLTALPPLADVKDIDALAEQFDQQLNFHIETTATEKQEFSEEVIATEEIAIAEIANETANAVVNLPVIASEEISEIVETTDMSTEEIDLATAELEELANDLDDDYDIRTVEVAFNDESGSTEKLEEEVLEDQI